MVYTNGRAGIAKMDPTDDSDTLQPLFEAILQHVPPPKAEMDEVLQLLVANLDYSDYLGRLAIGRVFNGTLKLGDEVGIAKLDGTFQKTRITKLYAFEGLERVDENRQAGRYSGYCRRGRHHDWRDGDFGGQPGAAAAHPNR